jgi:cyanophycinase
MFRKTLFVSLLILTLVFVSLARQRLVLIGGGKRPPEVLQKFAEFSGGAPGKILVVTWASGEPQASFEAFKTDLEKVSEIRIENAPVRPLNEQTKRQFLAQLKTATGVFFTGGDQNRITDVLQDEELRRSLREKYAAGVAFGGTSAGTAVVSEIMITGEGDFSVIDAARVETKNGLGLLPEVIVDQHFIKRQRQNRLISLMLKNPSHVGVGIDEDTAFLVTDNRYGEVLGASQVMIFDARQKSGAMRFFLLKAGEKFDLKKRKKINGK